MPDQAPIIDTSTTQAPAAATPATAKADSAAPAPSGGTDGKDTSQTPASPAKVEYDFRIPEGFKAPDGFVEKIKGRAAEYGLSKEGADKFFKNEVEAMKNADAEFLKAETERQAAWKKEIESDKDLGGDNLAKTTESARKGFAAASAKVPGLRDFISNYGFGNEPTMVRLLNYIGSLSANDTVDRATTPATNAQPKPLHERLYAGAQ